MLMRLLLLIPFGLSLSKPGSHATTRSG